MATTENNTQYLRDLGMQVRVGDLTRPETSTWICVAGSSAAAVRALPGPVSLAGVAFVHEEGAANRCRPRSLDLPHVPYDLKPKTPVTHYVWQLFQSHVVLLKCRKAVPDFAVAPSKVVQPILHLDSSPLPWSCDQDEAH